MLVREQSKGKAFDFIKRNKVKNIAVLIGDFTKDNLGLNGTEINDLYNKINIIYHIGAVYDVKVSREEAYKANVVGTGNMLNFAKAIINLKRFIYVSSAYICGLDNGRILEDELIRPKRFKCFYDESKYEAEVLVREYIGKLPVVILRPGIVVGNSQTGETDKFDGIYKLIKFIQDGKLIFKPGACSGFCNIVPVDFVCKAAVYISWHKGAVGKTFHLTSADYITYSEFIEWVCSYLKIRSPFTIPLALLKPLFLIKKISKDIIFMNNTLFFDRTNTEAVLKEGNITCPYFTSFMPNIMKFYTLKYHQSKGGIWCAQEPPVVH